MDPRPVALVTGGARRVGRAIVERLAADGFAVAITYLHSNDDAKALAAKVGGVAIRADLTDPIAAEKAILDGLGDMLPKINVLVNNASLFEPGESLQLGRRMMAIHYESPVGLARALSDPLRRNLGSVVNLLDLLAEKPWPGHLAYCASKAALWNATLSLAKQFAPAVTVNGIAPGAVEWPDDYPAEDREKYLSRVPLGRVGTPADVAAAVSYFVHARYVTGQVLRIDGGRSIV